VSKLVGPKSLLRGYIKVDMKKSVLLLLPFLSLTLTSCGQNSATFSNRDNPALPYIDQNGEVALRKEATTNANKDLVWASSAPKVIQDLKDYEYAFLFFYGLSCGHCLAFEPTFVQFVLDSSCYVYGIASDDEPNLMTELSAAYPNGNFSSVLYAGTPTLYFLAPSGNATRLELSSATSLAGFESYVASLLNRTAITHFKTYAAYEAYSKTTDSLFYIESKSNPDSLSFYKDNVRGLARHVDRPAAVIDWDSVSSLDQASFATALGFDVMTPYLTGITKGGSVATSFNIVSAKEAAIAAVSDYFNA
jgi:thiol-disulfide isomerase/thioredoxin